MKSWQAGHPVAARVAERWPEAVVDGRLDRGLLGRIVFGDPTQLAELEALTHPAIRLLIERWASRSGRTARGRGDPAAQGSRRPGLASDRGGRAHRIEENAGSGNAVCRTVISMRAWTPSRPARCGLSRADIVSRQQWRQAIPRRTDRPRAQDADR